MRVIDAASLDAKVRLKGEMTFCSWQRGWRSVLLRSYVDPPKVDDLRTAPTSDLLLVLVTKGSCDIEARYGKRWQSATYRVGHLGMTAPGTEALLRWQGAESHATLQLHLPSSVLRDASCELAEERSLIYCPPNRLAHRNSVIAEIMLDLADACRRGAPDLYAETAAHFLSLHMIMREKSIAQKAVANDDRRRLDRVEEFMRANLSAPLSLAQLARAAGLSRFQLLRATKSSWSETPMRRLTALRMSHAARLLTNSDLSIIEVALECGYAHPSHFAAAFKRHVGLTPTALRAAR